MFKLLLSTALYKKVNLKILKYNNLELNLKYILFNTLYSDFPFTKYILLVSTLTQIRLLK